MTLDREKIERHSRQSPRVREWVREVLLLDRVDSTNRIALEMASDGLPEGMLILAESQERGKGRLGRKWFSPSGVNLYFSLLLRPHQPVREFPLFSIATSIGLVHGIRSATGLAAQIKWPNDILLDEKKVGGILLESETGGAQNPPLVVGVGINVNVDPGAFPLELQSSATSLKAVLGRPVDRETLLLSILDALADQYFVIHEGKKDLLIETMRPLCRTIGKRIRVETPRQTFEGWAEEIQEDGALVVRMGDRSLRKIIMGDVTHLRETETSAS